MISSIITDKFNDLVLDTTTVAGLVFITVLVIYFFVAIKPALDSRIRVNRIVRRRHEYDKADKIYQSANKQQQGIKGGALENKAFFTNNNKVQKNNGYYKKDKGYQAYLKRNSLVPKQVIKHQRFKTASSILKPTLANSLMKRDDFAYKGKKPLKSLSTYSFKGRI